MFGQNGYAVQAPVVTRLGLMRLWLTLFYGVFSFSILIAAPLEHSAPPNIVIILADDQGYGGSGAYGGNPKYVRTPHIDSLAARGVRFTNGYVMNSVCGPSRATLMTGRYGQRFGYYTNDARWAADGLPISEKVIPQYLKPLGYDTALIGKWHLGINAGRHPLDKGYDEFFGFDSSGTSYFKSNIMHRGRTKLKQHDYLTTAFTREAVSFIERRQSNPFFLYLAYNAVHDPVEVPEAYANRFDTSDPVHNKRCGMLAALDEGVGKVIDALERTGKEDNTIIFYLSDNGGLANWPPGNNGPLRGFKRSLWEGGIRVQFMACWPGHFPPGTVSNELVSSMDILPTILDAIGRPLPDTPLDGRSLMGLLTGRNPAPIHDYLVWANRHFDELKVRDEYVAKHHKWPPSGLWKTAPAGWAVRDHRWKLIDTGSSSPQLFDLDKDISEQHNLADQFPQKVRQLKAVYLKWIKQMKPPLGWDQAYYQNLLSVK